MDPHTTKVAAKRLDFARVQGEVYGNVLTYTTGTNAATVLDEDEKGGGADGLEPDAAEHIYATDDGHSAISCRVPSGGWETIAHDPRLLWPDIMSIAPDDCLSVKINHLRRQARYHGEKDPGKTPYALFRIRFDAQPVLLRRCRDNGIFGVKHCPPTQSTESR
ncbi:MAG: hypothetical protein ACR2OU_11775 [Thermomicrobiales bacterium]